MSGYDIRAATILISDLRGRLVRNPNYGGPSVGLNGWHWLPELSKHGKAGFHEALKEDIQKHGVRNPVVAWSLPEGLFLTFGGSRVRACQEIGVKTIIAIVNDYTGDYSHYPLVTPDNYHEFFKDVPKTVEFTEHGFDYHYSLEMARRHDYDPGGFAWLGDERPAWIAKEFPWLKE